MNRALVIAVGLALLAGPAASQCSSRSDDHDFTSDRRERDGGYWRDGGRWRDMMRDDDHFGRRGGGPGARFMVRSGDAVVAVRCDGSESMRACVDATLTLLERVRASPAGAAPGASSGATQPPRQP
jgi:hypothetical protein